MRITWTHRLLAAAVAGSTLLVAGATLASAHVTVTAPGATRGGGDQQITFRVPVEKNIDTVGLKIALPTDTPIADVLVEPVTGWTHKETSVKLAKPIVTDDGNITDAVSQIEWTAQPGHGLVPGEFGAFTIIAGQLPDTAQLTFKAIQTYSDGSKVNWTQTEAPGSTADLNNPAPVLTLAPAAADAGATPTASPSAAASPAVAAPADASRSSSATDTTKENWALILSLLALVLAVAGLAVAATRRRSPRGL